MNIFLCYYMLLHSISSNAWATLLGLVEEINDVNVLTRHLFASLDLFLRAENWEKATPDPGVRFS